MAFASASGSGGTKEALIENLIGYTLTEQVQINMTTRAFERIRVQSEGVNKASDPALMGGALSEVRAQCNYLGVGPYRRPML